MNNVTTGKRGAWQTEVATQVSLAIPLALVTAGQQLMSVVDTAIVGRMGAVELAAVGLGNALWGFVLMTLVGVVMALDPLITQALGAGDPRLARARLWQGLHLCTWLGLVGWAALLVLPRAVAPLQADARMASLTTEFLQWRAPSILAALWFTALRSWLQGTGTTRPLLTGMILANVVNAVLAQALVHGGESLPPALSFLSWVQPLGVRGAAVASACATLAQLAWVVAPVAAGGTGLAVRRTPESATMMRILRLGLPLAVQMGAEVGLFSLVGVMAGALGTLDMAAHQVAIQVASLSFTVSLGMGSAGCVRVGHAVGARDAAATRRNGFVALGMGLGWMATMAGVLWTFPGAAARLLTDQADAVAASMPLLQVAAVFQLSDGAQAVGAGVLRGAADTRFLSLVNVVGHYGVGLPVALVLCFPAGMGITGLWWGLCAGLSFVAVALLLRFERLSRNALAPA